MFSLLPQFSKICLEPITLYKYEYEYEYEYAQLFLLVMIIVRAQPSLFMFSGMIIISINFIELSNRKTQITVHATIKSSCGTESHSEEQEY